MYRYWVYFIKLDASDIYKPYKRVWAKNVGDAVLIAKNVIDSPHRILLDKIVRY